MVICGVVAPLVSQLNLVLLQYFWKVLAELILQDNKEGKLGSQSAAPSWLRGLDFSPPHWGSQPDSTFWVYVPENKGPHTCGKVDRKTFIFYDFWRELFLWKDFYDFTVWQVSDDTRVLLKVRRRNCWRQRIIVELWLVMQLWILSWIYCSLPVYLSFAFSPQHVCLGLVQFLRIISLLFLFILILLLKLSLLL